jgi:Domain of unknown function (DUF4157)
MTAREAARPKARREEARRRTRMSQAGPRSALTDTEALQRSAGNAAVTAAAALDGAARVDIERRLGQPLPDARVHSGPEADAFLANERALGLARGRDVYLPAGVDPSGALGRTLIAHELAHVVQQTRAAPVDQAAELESEAEAVGFGEADAVAGSAPFGSSQRFLGLFEDEEEPPKKAELPPDFNRLQYARIAENPQAWKEALQYPAQAAHMRDDPAIRGLLQEDKEFQAWLANPKQLPPDYKPSAPLADADTAAERVRVPKVEQSFDDRTNTWTFTEDGQVVGQIKVPNKNSQFKVNWDRDQIVLDPSSDKGVNLVGADPPQKTEAGAYVETAPLTVVGNQPQRKARPKEPTPQEKFVSQLSEEERKRAEANRGRPLKHYYTKEMAELDKVPGFLEVLDYAGPIPVGTIGWQLGTLVTGETISGLPVERSETAKQIGEEVAMGIAIDWIGGQIFKGLGKLAGPGEELVGREVGDALSREGRLSLEPMPRELPNLTPDPHMPPELGKVPPTPEIPVEVPPKTTIEGAPKIETPEVKVEAPEVKSETPEVKSETREVKETPETKGETRELTEKPKPKLKGLKRISSEAMASLEKTFGKDTPELKKALNSFKGAGDDIIAAVNRFHDNAGFDQVMRDYVSRGNKQVGARHVMRGILDLPPEVDKLVMFETPDLRKATGQPARISDVWAAGARDEYKSVREVYSSHIKQLESDIISASAGSFGEGGQSGWPKVEAELARRRWVFDGPKMRSMGMTEADVAKQLADRLFAEGRLLQHHPYESSLRSWMERMVVFR